MIYTLKDGKQIESIPVGRSSVKIGEISPDGMLTVCDRGPAPSSGRGATVICKCHCGNYTWIKLNAFRSGTTKSCGCYNKEIHKQLCSELGKKSTTKDYTQIENPFYYFIEPTKEKDGNNSFYWLIKCKKCGRFYKEVPAQVVSDTRYRGKNPCQCWQWFSKGELKIARLLEENNISYSRQVKMPGCNSLSENPLKFDFQVSNYLIEYDGEQHFIPQSFGDTKISAELKLETTQLHDKIKNEYCKEHNIPLIRIPYTHYEDLKIEDLLLNTTTFKI